MFATYLDFVLDVLVVELLTTGGRKLGRGSLLLRLVVVFYIAILKQSSGGDPII